MCLVCRPSRYQEDETDDQMALLHIIFKRCVFFFRGRAEPSNQQRSFNCPYPASSPQTQPRRHDPRPSAERFLKAFAEAVAARAVDKGRVLPLVRTWRALSTLSGTDASWGIIEGVVSLLGISDAELEGPTPVGAHAPPEDT